MLRLEQLAGETELRHQHAICSQVVANQSGLMSGDLAAHQPVDVHARRCSVVGGKLVDQRPEALFGRLRPNATGAKNRVGDAAVVLELFWARINEGSAGIRVQKLDTIRQEVGRARIIGREPLEVLAIAKLESAREIR